MSTEASEVGAEASLASIFSSEEPASEPAAPAVVEAAPAAPAEAPESKDSGPARDASGKFAPKSAEPPAEPAPPAKAEEPAKSTERPDFVNAIIAQRKQLQAAKAAAAAQAPPATKTDFFENPDRAVEEKVGPIVDRYAGAIFKMSLKAAKSEYGEAFDHAAEAFTQASKENPRLIEALQNDDDPGEFIYNVGMQIRELADVGGDLGRYREKVTAASRTELTAAQQRIKSLEDENATLKKQYSDLSTVRPSLNSASGRQVAAHDVDDEDLKKITRFGNS